MFLSSKTLFHFLVLSAEKCLAKQIQLYVPKNNKSNYEILRLSQIVIIHNLISRVAAGVKITKG